MADPDQPGRMRGKPMPQRRPPRERSGPPGATPAPAAAKADESAHGDEAFRPILNERPLRRFDALTARPRSQARIALVVVGARGRRLYLPEQRPTAGELLWGGGGTLYEVDMGLHHTMVEFDLPTNGDAFAFHARAMIEWRVTEPVQIVADAVRDVRETLRPPLEYRLGSVTRDYFARAVANAEDKCREELARTDLPPLGQNYGLSATVYLRLTMDAAASKQLTSLDDLQYQTELERVSHELRRLQEANNEELLAGRRGTYRELIAKGHVEMLAQQLAQNPTDVASVIQAWQDEQNTNRRHAAEFITLLLESGVLEKWQIDDQARAALELLKRSADRVIRPVDNPPPAGANALPGPDLTKSPLSGGASPMPPPIAPAAADPPP